MEELTPEQNYRFAVIESINYLKQSKQEVFVKLVNIAMAGKLADFDSLFGEGDDLEFDDMIFEELYDHNISELLRVYRITRDTIKYLQSSNKIADDELDIEITE